ncbi:class I SAM-dependent methyltransferase [Pseudomonas sp. KCJK8927]|uniref:class I SAM-dependent methyltransferase n=1 Tax=Pseudomonas sp. KCJK8927 TaxID=3344560 RepID=UPI003905EA8A
MPHRWCDSAKIRYDQIESGLDLTFNDVFKPFYKEKITALHPSKIMEVGAGTGHLSKEIFSLGYKITALEPSKGMYDVAKHVLKDTDVTLLNCTSGDLKEHESFDLAFSHLVAHAVDDLPVFIGSIFANIRSGGYFIFSIPHPCFYNNYKNFLGVEYNYMTPMKKIVSFKITKDLENAISNVPYNHRPISTYINTLISTGFVLADLNEIYPNQKTQEKYGAVWEEPRYCVFTCRKS